MTVDTLVLFGMIVIAIALVLLMGFGIIL